MTIIEKSFQKYKRLDNISLIERYSDKKSVSFRFGNIRRYFCECGQVGTYNEHSDAKCEACGNNKFHFLGEFYRRYIKSTIEVQTHLRRHSSLGKDPLIINEHILEIKVDDNEEYLELSESTNEILRIESGEASGHVVTGRYGSYNNQWILDEVIAKSPYFPRIKDMYDKLKESGAREDLLQIIRLMNLSVKNPHLKLNEFVKHKEIWKYINEREPALWNTLVDFQDFLDLKCVDPKLVPIIDMFYRAGYYWYTYEDFFKLFSNFEETEKDIIVNCLDQSTLTTYQVNNFAKDLKLLKEDKRYKDTIHLFHGFLKENIIIYSSNVISEFKDRVNFLKNHSIEVNEYSLKTKQYKLSRNYAELSEQHKIPKEKVDIFIDLIDEDPLKALKFIKDRRKLTKKQIDEILAMQED